MDLLRKLLITSAIIFVSKGSNLQLIVGILVSLAFLVLSMDLHPYNARKTYVLQVCTRDKTTGCTRAH